MNYPNLNPSKALLWQVMHLDSLPMILEHGLHCANAGAARAAPFPLDPTVWHEQRRHRVVPLAPPHTLADYVSFQFTPFSMLMRRLVSGRGLRRRRQDELVILVSSVERLRALDIPVLFTDVPAGLAWANYYDQVEQLGNVDWALLQHGPCEYDADDPRRIERYQAEALVRGHVPATALLGLVCGTAQTGRDAEALIAARRLAVPIHVRTAWFAE